MKKYIVNEIENISLSAKQIKAKLEDSLAYDHDKFSNIEILFSTKQSQSYKLPFSDYKISISEELYNKELLLEDLHQYIESTKLIEEKVEVEELFVEPPIVIEEEENDDINIIEEVYEYDDIIEDDEDEEYEEDEDEEEEKQYAQLPYNARAKRPKGYTIKVVDVQAVIKKIKDEARAKNEGKPVIGRRQINKLLKPYMLKKNNSMDIDGIDNALTSIDIYLSAVDKITATDLGANKNSSNSLELNLNDILDDLEK